MFTGIRPQTRLRAPTAFPSPSANRLLAVLNIAMADTAFTIWSAKRFYGDDAGAGDVAAGYRHPAGRRRWQSGHGSPTSTGCLSSTRRRTRNILPDIPVSMGRPRAVLLGHFSDGQTFTLTTPGQPNRTYTSIRQARADGNNARVWGGMHYPSTVAISDAVGRAIARYVDRNSMQRLHWRRHGAGACSRC